MGLIVAVDDRPARALPLAPLDLSLGVAEAFEPDLALWDAWDPTEVAGGSTRRRRDLVRHGGLGARPPSRPADARARGRRDRRPGRTAFAPYRAALDEFELWVPIGKGARVHPVDAGDARRLTISPGCASPQRAPGGSTSCASRGRAAPGSSGAPPGSGFRRGRVIAPHRATASRTRRPRDRAALQGEARRGPRTTPTSRPPYRCSATESAQWLTHAVDRVHPSPGHPWLRMSREALIDGGDPARRAQVLEHALLAARAARVADPAPVPDQQVREAGPVRPRHDPAADRARSSPGSSCRVSPSRCESRRTCVSTTIPCACPSSAATTFAVLRATPGSLTSSVEPRRHLAVELLEQHPHRAADRLRLLPEEARRVDVALELLLRHRQVVLGLRYLSKSAR